MIDSFVIPYLYHKVTFKSGSLNQYFLYTIAES